MGSKDKHCPIMGERCIKSQCAWWCEFSGMCAFLTLTAIIATNSISRIVFGGGCEGDADRSFRREDAD